MEEQRVRRLMWLHHRDQASRDPHAWADWARKLLAEKSEDAARVIAQGKQHKWLSDQEIAARQVEESRAARAIL